MKKIVKLGKEKSAYEINKGTIEFIFVKIFSIAIFYLFMLIVTKNLGPKVWGIFTLCLTVLQISTTFGKAGFDFALIKLINTKKNSKSILKKTYKIVVPLSIVTSFVIFSTSDIIAKDIFRKPYLNTYFKIISIGILPYVLIFVTTSVIRAYKSIKEYVFLQQTLPYLLSTIIIILLLFTKLLSIKMVLYTFLLSIMLTSLISFKRSLLYLNNYSRENPDNIISYNEILNISLPMFISSALGMVMSWTDTIMLGIFTGEKEVGIYNVAIRLSLLIAFALTAVNSIALPKFAELWREKKIKELYNIATYSTRLIFYLTIPLLLIFLAIPGQIMHLFGVYSYTGKVALILLAITQFINAICGSTGGILLMTGYQKFHQNTVIIGVGLNIILNYILIPRYGIIGAAIATSLGIIFWNVVFTIKVKNILGGYIIYLPLIRSVRRI